MLMHATPVFGGVFYGKEKGTFRDPILSILTEGLRPAAETGNRSDFTRCPEYVSYMIVDNLTSHGYWGDFRLFVSQEYLEQNPERFTVNHDGGHCQNVEKGTAHYNAHEFMRRFGVQGKVLNYGGYINEVLSEPLPLEGLDKLVFDVRYDWRVDREKRALLMRKDVVGAFDSYHQERYLRQMRGNYVIQKGVVWAKYPLPVSCELYTPTPGEWRGNIFVPRHDLYCHKRKGKRIITRCSCQIVNEASQPTLLVGKSK